MNSAPPASFPEAAEVDRSAFPVLREVPLRWADHDTWGHVNNAVHYLLIDTAVNGWLIEASGVDIRELDAAGLVVENGCRYFAQLKFPEPVSVGIALEATGRSSVRYRVGIFQAARAIAVARFHHVYVDRTSGRPVPVPKEIRYALTQLNL